MATTDARETLRAKVEELQQTFPTVGFSFGYIGNCNNRYDDRGWMIFAQQPHTSFGTFRTHELDRFVAALNTQWFARWLTRTVVDSQLMGVGR